MNIVKRIRIVSPNHIFAQSGFATIWLYYYKSKGTGCSVCSVFFLQETQPKKTLFQTPLVFKILMEPLLQLEATYPYLVFFYKHSGGLIDQTNVHIKRKQKIKQTESHRVLMINFYARYRVF